MVEKEVVQPLILISVLYLSKKAPAKLDYPGTTLTGRPQKQQSIILPLCLYQDTPFYAEPIYKVLWTGTISDSYAISSMVLSQNLVRLCLLNGQIVLP